MTCKHGEIECTGNIQQLCAQKYLEQDVWWPFVTCQNVSLLSHLRSGCSPELTHP